MTLVVIIIVFMIVVAVFVVVNIIPIGGGGGADDTGGAAGASDLPGDEDASGGETAGGQKPTLEPAVDEDGVKGSAEGVGDDAADLLGHVAAEQERRRDDVGGADLADEQGEVGVGVALQDRGREAREEMHRLQHAVERRQQHDAREEEGDLSRPREPVQARVPVLGHEREQVRDRVRAREGRLGPPPAPERRRRRRHDAVQAVDREGVREDAQASPRRGRGAPLLGPAPAQDRERRRQRAAHRIEAANLHLQRLALLDVGVAADGPDHLADEASVGRVRQLPLQQAQPAAFALEELARRPQATLAAGDVRLRHGPDLDAERLPERADRREPGQQRHQRDAHNADPLETGLPQGRAAEAALLVAVVCPWQALTDPPERGQPSGHAYSLDEPGEPPPGWARRGKVPSGRGDD